MRTPDLTTLVDKQFWEQEYYWADEKPPVRPDPGLPFDRAMSAALADLAPVAKGGRVLEVGCAPAKWLAFYGERFGAAVEGIEYSEKGAELSRANLAACGVEGSIRCEDFFTCAVTEHDLVVSLGFIEHFDELERVFARHVEFTKPGGRLLVGVPNFRGFNALLQRWAEPEYLAKHNVRAMEPGLYRRLAREHGLEVEQIRYIGGPDPIIVRIKPGPVTWVAMAEARVRRIERTARVNHRWFSPYLMTTYRRPA